ncbi:curli production assembly/transport component CsgF [Hymenobacter cavernae]|uniref:Curli production assembly/transport component CsgF n=1 Tax=Hymenobacter cavernae TaxID=2044852 RepID=A0ABQ1TMD9_9BACT|nr:curli production assembly/transport component CsgF [Hymenobacter cavernae]GGE97064.1 curli production assembly protein CsgF [Hymenobacter cavernae]
MKVPLLRWALLLTLLTLGLRQAKAQDFIYEPKNPSFGGGNTFNYSWLLSSAQAQNSIPDPATRSASTAAADPLSNFAANLNQQILAQLTNRFITAQFGTGAIREGNYTVGNYRIQVTPGSSGVSIQVTDVSTGNQTTVTVPNGP